MDGSTKPAVVLDSASGLTALQRIKLNGRLGAAMKELAGAKSALQRIKLSGEIGAILAQLGASAKPVAPAISPEPPAQVPAVPKADTRGLYEYREDVSKGQRQRDNNAAVELLAEIEAGRVDGATLTDEQKKTLALYSGNGGSLMRHDGLVGSAYEYYTPPAIAQGIWNMLDEMGFGGGKVLDPSAGTGVFGATAPQTAAIDAVELDKVSGRINGLVNNGPSYQVTVSNFESIAAKTPDESHDAVVTNVPFGDVAARGAHRFDDPKYQSKDLGAYFVLRSLDKLKPGGLAAFIVPRGFVSNKGDGKPEETRQQCSLKAEFMGAYRLPNKIFESAAADVVTDVVVFRKYSRAAADKIAELREQNPDVLAAAGVLWPEFIEGRYFEGDGKRFILGTVEMVEGRWKDSSGKARLIEAVVNDGTVQDIARLMRKLPASRIDWKMLDTAETTPIVYREGDAMSLGGQTLEMRGGRWQPVKPPEAPSTTDIAFGRLTEAMRSPAAAFEAEVHWDEAKVWYDAMIDRDLVKQTPDWFRECFKSVMTIEPERQEVFWLALVVAMSVRDAKNAHMGDGVPFNYAEAYPQLNVALKTHSGVKTSPASFSREAKKALELMRTVYSRKLGYIGWWMGAGDKAVEVNDELTETQRYEALRYGSGDNPDAVATAFRYVPIAEMKAQDASFNPLESDEWCISPDGESVMHADDYYQGNLAEFYARVDAEMTGAANDTIRAKIARQKANVEKRIRRIDVTKLRLTLNTPLVKLEDKLRFVRENIDSRFELVFPDSGDGEPVIKIDLGSAKMGDKNSVDYVRAKALELMWSWFKDGGYRLGAMPDSVSDATKDAILKEMRRIAKTANTQFNTWVQASPEIMDTIKARANNPKNIWIRETANTRGFDIAGIRKGKDPITGDVAPFPKGYQFTAINRFSRSFGGILGDGVGLGKTFQALWTVANVHNTGVKKKTLIVVPNSVLPNWRKEAKKTYESLDDCLFVGLEITKDADGKESVVRQAGELVKRHLNEIIENKHRKIFMTVDDFVSIPLKGETIAAYKKYLIESDAALGGMTSGRADAKEKADAFLAALVDTMEKRQKEAVPFFEVMGVDSVVFDEAHVAKNSKEVVEFRGAKMLATPEASARGLDMQCKSWMVRSGSPHNDGVLALTATPITNSPLEVFSMLTLAVGEDRVKRMMMDCEGADSFMNLFSIVDDVEGTNIAGEQVVTRTFDGLQNLQVLREAMQSIALIRTADDVGEETRVPEAVEKAVPVQLPAATVTRLKLYKDAYQGARLIATNKAPSPDQLAAMQTVMEQTGDEPKLIAHPFNLIKKMQSLIMDPEMDEGVTRFAVSDLVKAAAVVKRFNDAKVVEEREKLGMLATEAEIVKKKVVMDEESGKEKEIFFVHVKAFVDDGKRQITIDTVQYKAQSKFVGIAEKQKLDLDVTIPPKLADLIENFKIENGHPRHGSRAKQIIFNDNLAMHQKIRIALEKHCGIPKSRIAIINAQAVDDASEVQDISDGFNADGEENQFQTVIANKKAEVGLNLQKGTQAIHHMTLGWTPDSITQRNGRGVRQGNPLDFVNVYYYEADGTFDKYKRTLVDKKGDWIGAVMSPEGGETAQASGQLSDKEYDAMIQSIGDASAMDKFNAQREEAERARRAAAAKEAQTIIARTIVKQKAVTGQSFADFVLKEVGVLESYSDAVKKARARIGKAQTESAKAKANALLDDATANFDGTLERIADTTKDNQGTNYDATSKEKLRRDVLSHVTGSSRRNLYLSHFFAKERIEESSELYRAWASGKERAEKIVAQSLADFASYTDMGTGGYSKEAVSQLAAGEATFEGDQIAYTGCLIGKEGTWYIIDKLTAWTPGSSYGRATSVADLLKSGAPGVYEPGTPGYVEGLRTMAAGDDALLKSGVVPVSDYDRNRFYYPKLPAVCDYMTVEIPRLFDPDEVTLPAPFYPKVLDQSDTADYSDAPTAKKLMEQQKAAGIIVSRKNYHSTVTLPKGIDSLSEPVQVSAMTQMLMTLAKADGQRVTPADARLTGTGYDYAFKLAIEEDGTVAKIAAITAEQAPNRVEFNKLVWDMAEAIPGILVKRSAHSADITSAYSLPRLLTDVARLKMTELVPGWNAAAAAAAAAAPPPATPAPIMVGGMEFTEIKPAVDPADVVPEDMKGMISSGLNPKRLGEYRRYLDPKSRFVVGLYTPCIAKGLKMGTAWAASGSDVRKFGIPADWQGQQIAYIRAP
jgi:hypothetical protein